MSIREVIVNVNAQSSVQTDFIALVNISSQVWPPRHRTYFGSLVVRSPEPGARFAVTPIRACKGVMDLGDKRTMEFSISDDHSEAGSCPGCRLHGHHQASA